MRIQPDRSCDQSGGRETDLSRFGRCRIFVLPTLGGYQTSGRFSFEPLQRGFAASVGIGTFLFAPALDDNKADVILYAPDGR
jgi:hypothetical protein